MLGTASDRPRSRRRYEPHVVPTGGTHVTRRTRRSIPENTKPPEIRGFCMKRMKGFEPSTFAMARRRSSQLSYIRALAPF